MAGPLLPSGKIILPDTTRKPATSSTTTDWVRPSDWLPMPRVEAYEQKICILHAVFNHDSNFAAFTIAGNYTVDWGDGTVDNVNSGVTALHNYSYSNATLTGTECSRGYKQAMITITPQSGANLTSVNFYVKYTGLADNSSTGFLDFILSAPNCTSMTFSGSAGATVRHCYLERALFLSGSPGTTLANFFSNSYALVVFSIIGLNTASVTSISAMFQQCYSILNIDLSNLNLSSVTNASSFSISCGSLRSFKLPALGVLTSVTYMFAYCSSLINIDVSALNFGSITSLAYFCTGCSRLKSATLPSLSSSAITTISNFASGCSSIEALDLSSLTTASLTTTTDAFKNCYSLSSLVFPSHASFDITNCRLSATALNTLYAQLPTGLTGKTLTVTGNYGTSGDDPSLRPAGWEITG